MTTSGRCSKTLMASNPDSNPADATESLDNLQADLPILISSAQSALESMSSGLQTLQGLNQSSPYSQSEISSANVDLTQALPLSSASNASNRIQKAISDANSYNSGHSMVSEISSLQPVSSLIGQGGQQEEAQKVLSLPFQTAPASPSSSSAPSPQAPPSVKSAVQTEPAGKQAPVKIAKPENPHLASTGSDVEAAALGAAILLTVGVAAELLKNKKRRKNR